MNSLDLFKQVVDKLLPQFPANEAREFSFILLNHFFGLSKTQIIANKTLETSAETLNLIDNYCNRLLTNEPIQYITQKAYFLDFEFEVNPSVLIPRGETEELVLWIENKMSHINGLEVLDVCTGSGCIAVALQKLLPNSSVTALDVSPTALETAKRNAKLNNADIVFVESDILDDGLETNKFDIIVSNPPYVLEIEKTTMQANVLEHEPHLALFVPNHKPLLFYTRIAKLSFDALKQNGLLALEINEQFGKETAECLSGHGFEKTEIIKDIHGKDRFVIGYKL